MTNPTPVVQKEAWVAPEIQTLDVGETYRVLNRGNDGGNYPDSLRS